MIVNLEAVEVRHAHSDFQLTIPSLQIEAGEFVTVCGASGSGKSTLLDVCAGVVPAASGKVSVLGLDLGRRRGRRVVRRQGTYLVQRGSVVEYLTAMENVIVAGEIVGIRRNVAGARAALESVGLASQEGSRVSSLSGGQRQRVAMASAIYRRSPLVWADEPTSALDATNAELVLEGLRDLSHRAGAAVMCVTHDTARARTYSDRILVLRDGVVTEGTTHAQGPRTTEPGETSEGASR